MSYLVFDDMPRLYGCGLIMVTVYWAVKIPIGSDYYE